MFKEKLRQVIAQPKLTYLWVLILGVAPIFHWFSLMLMIVVCLRNGAKEGFFLALMLVGITVIQLHLFLHLSFGQMGFEITGPLFLWILAVVLRSKASWTHVFEVTTVIGIAIILGVYAFFPRIALEWNLRFVALMEQTIQAQSNLLANVDAKALQKAILMLGQFGTGLRALVYVGAMFITLLISRSIQAVLYNPGGLKREFYQWHLQPLFGIALIVLMLCPIFFHQGFWLSIVPVLTLAPLCVGLSLFHSYTARFKYQWVVLLVFYLVIPFIAQLLLVVVFLGLLDSFVNFRMRYPSLSRG